MAPRPAWVVLTLLAVALLMAVGVAVAVGSVAVPLADTVAALARHLGTGGEPGRWDAIVFLVRLPRVVGAVLIGAALAVAGTVMQGLLRNPLADPGIIGVSGGAGFGAVLAIALGVVAQSRWALPLAASAGALTASALIFALAARTGRLSVFPLVLAGIAVSTFFGAGTSLALSFASRDSIAQFVFWSMGNLTSVTWDTLALVGVPAGLGLAVLLLFGRDLNVLLLGDDEARSVGLNVPRIRLLLLIVASVTTASAVCVSGPIAFVGLMVPHILRLLLGSDHRVLLPAAALGGGLFLTLCDLVARTVLGAQEVNVGIVTALLGAPYFLFLLLRTSRGRAL